MKRTGLLLMGVVVIGGMLTTGVVMAAGNGNAGNNNGTPATPGNCQMVGQQGQMGKGQARMAQTIATLANKPVDEVLKTKQPGVTWLQVAEKFGVKQEQFMQENMKQHMQNGGTCNGPCQAATTNGQNK